MGDEEFYLHLPDMHKRLVAIHPASIAFMLPIHERKDNSEKAFIFFWGENKPRVFNVTVDEIAEALDTFFNANE